MGLGRIDGMRRQNDKIDVVRANELKYFLRPLSVHNLGVDGNVLSSRMRKDLLEPI